MFRAPKDFLNEHRFGLKEKLPEWLTPENLANREKTSREFTVWHDVDGLLVPNREVSLVHIGHPHEIALHHHVNANEFLLVLEGSGIFVHGKKEKAFKPGDSFAVPKGMLHAFKFQPGQFVKLLSISSPRIRDIKTKQLDLVLANKK